MAPEVRNPKLSKVGDVSLELVERGAGRPVLLLHGPEGASTSAPYFDLLAKKARIFAPSHPGFGNTPLPDWIDGVDDLAYLYLDLLEELDLEDVVVVGLSMGGWIAAEMAIKNLSRISRLILVGAVGIKVSDRETRDIPDIYAIPPHDVAKLMFHNPEFAPKIEDLSDDELIAIARNREAAALYLWEPYMHNPKLRRRLRRVQSPTLFVRGSHDGIVSASYAKAYCEALPDARLVTIERAGHAPELEQPVAFVENVNAFLKE